MTLYEAEKLTEDLESGIIKTEMPEPTKESMCITQREISKEIFDYQMGELE